MSFQQGMQKTLMWCDLIGAVLGKIFYHILTPNNSEYDVGSIYYFDSSNSGLESLLVSGSNMPNAYMSYVFKRGSSH